MAFPLLFLVAKRSALLVILTLQMWLVKYLCVIFCLLLFPVHISLFLLGNANILSFSSVCTFVRNLSMNRRLFGGGGVVLHVRPICKLFGAHLCS